MPASSCVISTQRLEIEGLLGVCRIQAASNPYAGKSQPIGETRTRYSRKFRVNRAKGDVCCPHLTAKRDQSDRLLAPPTVRHCLTCAAIALSPFLAVWLARQEEVSTFRQSTIDNRTRSDPIDAHAAPPTRRRRSHPRSGSMPDRRRSAASRSARRRSSLSRCSACSARWRS